VSSLIQTPRLLLRPLEPADADVLYRIYQTEGVLRYFPTTTPPPFERVRKFVASQKVHWETHGYGNWGILPAGRVEIIGWAGLQFLPELSETELGYLLDFPHWGMGYATEAAHAALRFGFDHCRLDRIIALVHPDNAASRRVIEKSGMIYEETIRIWGVDLMCHGIETARWNAMPILNKALPCHP